MEQPRCLGWKEGAASRSLQALLWRTKATGVPALIRAGPERGCSRRPREFTEKNREKRKHRAGEERRSAPLAKDGKLCGNGTALCESEGGGLLGAPINSSPARRVMVPSKSETRIHRSAGLSSALIGFSDDRSRRERDDVPSYHLMLSDPDGQAEAES